jgi:hypothetical protein
MFVYAILIPIILSGLGTIWNTLDTFGMASPTAFWGSLEQAGTCLQFFEFAPRVCPRNITFEYLAKAWNNLEQCGTNLDVGIDRRTLQRNLERSGWI